MNYLILNGNPEAGAFDAYLDGLGQALRDKGHQVGRFELRGLGLGPCTGCWSCWWASPGVCARKDGIEDIHRAMVGADLVLWASPLILGNVSALLKTVQDRFVPLVHPYIELRGGESHHRPRYARDPDIGLIVAPGPEDGRADLELVRALFERFSRNSRGRLRLFATTETPASEVAASLSAPGEAGSIEADALREAAPRPGTVRSAAPAWFPGVRPRPVSTPVAGPRRLFLNGSPRGRESNSRLLLSWMAQGMAEAGVAGASEIPILDLARRAELPAQLMAVAKADEVLLVLPLYTDSVPAIVKAFLEGLAGLGREALRGKRLAIVVQSGFPESIHAETVARWLARATERLGFEGGGVLIRGGVEGIRIQPPSMTRRTREAFTAAGRELAGTGAFSPATAASIAGRRRWSPMGRLLIRLLSLTRMTNFYWDMNLRKHGAWERRFDAPYGEAYRAGV